MGSIVGNSLKLSQAGSTDSLKFDTAPDGMQFDGVRLNISCPVTVTGTPTLVQADLKAYMQRVLGSVTLEEGPKQARRLVYAAADGNDLRTVARWFHQNEIPNNVIGLQAAGAQTLTATVFVPFTQPGFLLGKKRRPGTTQVRQMLLRVVEGANAINGAIARAAGNITIEVEYVCTPGPDTWAPILSMQRESSPRRDALGPDGVTLLAYVPDQAASASPLTAFNVQVVDGQSSIRVTDLQSVAPVTRAFTDELVDQGAVGIVDEHTVIHFAGAGNDLDKVPHGQVRFEEAKTDLSPVNLRFIYFPSRDAQRAKAEAKTAADTYGGAVLVTQDVIGEDADPGAAATQPARIYAPSDARFTTKPGLLATSSSDVVTASVPEQYVKTVGASVAAVKGQGANVARDVSRRGVKVVSLAVPGSTATDGSMKGDVAEGISRAFAA